MQKLTNIGQQAIRQITDPVHYAREEIVNYSRQCLVDHCFHRHMGDALFRGERLSMTVTDISTHHAPSAYS